MDMATYVIMAFAVALLALLAGFTGGMPGPILSNPRSGSREGEGADANAAAEASSGGHSAERKLPSEILDAAAQAEHLGARSQVLGRFRCRDYRGLSLEPEGQPASPQVTDLGRLVLAGARSRLLAEIVDSLLQGTQFMTLTGARGVGKTTMAVAIREELSKRSVSVRWVDGGGGSGIHLRAIMFQVLGEPQADVDDGDIERLFDAMTERETPVQRWVLIIDDAERLLPDAIGYLRLLASVAMERMPQIVFVGDPSFWDIADQAAQAGFEDLITVRFELEPLSRREACVAAQRLMSALSPARRPVFDREALEAVIQRTDGLIGRLFPLVTAINAIATETDQTRVTTALIDAAAARLEGGLESLAPSAGSSDAAITAPVFRVAEAIAAARALVPILSFPRQEWGFVRRSGAAAAVVAGLGSGIYWLAPFGIDRIWAEARTAPLEDRNATGTASPDPAIIIRLALSTPMMHARLSTANSDGAITLQFATTVAASEIIEPSAILVPQIDPVAAAHRPAAGIRTVRARPTSSSYATPASKGVWLFPPNSNGGASG
jgi:type II secretory pathway predicted ATPase ExeA